MRFGWCFTLLCVYVTIQLANAEKPKLWAVLVAGSNGYYNYRHQADVCHAYQILHRHGIPEERIVVMMYDDIADSKENPTKGIIINHPNGSDVYQGVPKDYTKEMVTPSNFMKILKGIAPEGGSGKVIKPGPNDHVFVNFVDHGAPGILAFPPGVPVLTVKDFMNVLNDMHAENKYGKMVIYVEACESGSMFDNHLPPNISIFATTAANDNESSYACYFDNERQTYLGDLYSVKWMEDSDKENLQSETLEHQYKVTKKETDLSHVQQFGEMDIARMPVGEFQGESNTPPIYYEKVPLNAVRSTDVPLKIMEYKWKHASSLEEKKEIHKKWRIMLAKRRLLKSKMHAFAIRIAEEANLKKGLLRKRHQLNDLDCHDKLVKYFDAKCLSLGRNDYALRFMYLLVNACEEKVPLAQIIAELDIVCKHLQVNEPYL